MDLSDSAQLYGHLRILMATIIGLGVARLLIGFASMIEQPDRTKLSAVHLMWTASILLTLVNFWWWEFGLFSVIHWTYGDYIFLIAYCIVLFMLSALVFPSNIEKYRNYEDFFLSRRRWFFAFFAVSVIFDIFDSALKGWNYLVFDPEYAIAVPVALVASIIGVRTRNHTFHLVVASVQLLYQLSWGVRSIIVS